MGNGGESAINAHSGKISFVPWEVSAYAYARAYGFTDPQATAETGGTGEDTYSRVRYTANGVSVSAYNLYTAGPSAMGASQTATNAVTYLLETVSRSWGTAGSGNSAGGAGTPDSGAALGSGSGTNGSNTNGSSTNSTNSSSTAVPKGTSSGSPGTYRLLWTWLILL